MMANKEIEKRFLVTEVSPDFPFSSCAFRDLRQGYVELASSVKSFRARIIRDLRSSLIETELTVKSGWGMIRGEEKYERAFPDLIQFLFDNIIDHEVSKIRYLKDGWEIDFFKLPLSGIVLAEIEFKSGAEVPAHLQLPSWIGKGIDVTDSLTNHHLARLASLLNGTNLKALDLVMKKLNPPIPKIVITGGPCSGKSSIIKDLRIKRPEFHYVPEVATIVIKEVGVRPGTDELSNISFQETLYKVQRIFEATSMESAIENGKVGLILDRGTVDNVGYFPGGLQRFEDHLKTTLDHEYRQYKKVICLEIAPRDVYEKMKLNNPARSESYEQACALQEKMIDAWGKHPRFIFVTNGPGGWDEKEKKVIEILEAE